MDTATAKQLLQSDDLDELQAAATKYTDHQEDNGAAQVQMYKFLLLLNNRILQLQQADSNNNAKSITYTRLGKLWMALGDDARAKGQLEHAMECDEDGINYTAVSLLGDEHGRVGSYDKAIESHESALAMLETALKADNAKDHKETLERARAAEYSKLAAVFEQKGEFAQARTLLDKAIAAVCPDTSSVHARAIMYGHLGTVCEKMGLYAEAVTSLTVAAKSYQTSLGAEHSKTQEVEYLLEMAVSLVQ